jgi:predicted nucleic acid-binding protein
VPENIMEESIILAYLDSCCLGRPFDSHLHPQVLAEFHALREIKAMVRRKDLGLLWSFVLTMEAEDIRDERKKSLILAWAQLAISNVEESDNIRQIAKIIQQTGVKEKDALHVACAINAGCHFFVTTDHRLLKYQDSRVKICDPIECLEILHKIV